MNIRNSKIARLPLHIREQLNTRLLEKEPDNLLVDWLNAQPEVNAIMDSLFQGCPISEQDLSEWQSGCFLGWAAIDSCLDHSRLVSEGAEHVAGAGVSAEQLLRIITARFAELLQTMDVTPEDAFDRKMCALQNLAKTALALRRCEQHDVRLQLDRERLELQREKQRSKSASSASSPASSSVESVPSSAPSDASAPSESRSRDCGATPVCLNGAEDFCPRGPTDFAQSCESQRLESQGLGSSLPAFPRTPIRNHPRIPILGTTISPEPAAAPASPARPSPRNGTPSTASPRNAFGLL